MLSKLFKTNDDCLLTIIGLVVGILFFYHGAQKTLGWWEGPGFSATMTGFESMGIPAIFDFRAITVSVMLAGAGPLSIDRMLYKGNA